ncbi:MAG: Glycosyl transferase, group 1 family protein (modular protein) [Promethearchaeota archaeon]|nr:MAG: Glycosyl transferase, group 1 family protein (modular protein) [Candidatus Lokiarchaeota archaeon]
MKELNSLNIIYIKNFYIYKMFSNIQTIGGIEVTTNWIIDELRNRGHNVWVPSEQEKPQWVEDGEVDILCSSSFDPLTFYQLYRYRSKFKHRAAVVQHAHTTYEDLKGNILPDNPLINKILKYWIRILYSQAHLLMTPSEYAKNLLEAIQETRTYPIWSVSSGMIIDKFDEKKEYRPNFRKYLHEQFNVPLEATIILNVGLIWKRKRVDTFGEVAKALPQYYFVWVGPLENDPDIEEISQLKNVIFTGFYDDIREPYYGADVFLCTSEEENLCLPLIEASLSNLPIVTRDIEVFNWLEHDYSAYKATNLKEFIEGVEQILSNPTYREKLIQNANKKAKELHDFNDTVDTIEKYFEKALQIKRIWDRKRKESIN